ncbi:MAG: DHHA1 domain-containing protein [Terriglobia bacterium]
MQQHTGQHVLSAAFVRLFNLPTVSFHLGPDICTIDLKTAALRSKQLRQAEELANQAVFENRPVHIRFAQAEELTERELRKTVSRAGELRLIEVEDFDCCPCGGTHVARTGELGLIFVRSAEKTKGNTRVEFVCGRRALRVARTDHERLQEAARLLTTGAAELPDVIRKQMDERRAGERARKRLLERLAEHEARALLEGAETVGERRVVCRMMEEADGGWLRLLAARLVKQPGVQLLLGGKGKPAAVVFAQSPGLPADMNALLRETVGKLGGKGGGSRDFAQGSVPGDAGLEEALSEARGRIVG